jgi:DNA-binding phage protein
MATTRKFGDTIKRDLENSQEFRLALLGETINCMASGDVDTGKIALREYTIGTLGFVALGDAVGKSPKSLMRMLSPEGNPNIRDLFEIVAYLQKREGTTIRFEAVTSAA